MKYIPPLSNEEKTFCAHIEDVALRSRRTGRPSFSAFLNLRESELARMSANRVGVDAMFFGGFDGAERVMLGVGDHVSINDFPITSMCFSVSGSFDHRDALGSILGLGLERSFVGDIVVYDGGFKVYVGTSVAEFIKSELCSVGRNSCSYTNEQFEGEGNGKIISYSDTVASMRLDCIIAVMANCGREKATEYISSGRVQVNHLEESKPSFSVSEKDVLTLRGVGRFVILNADGRSKKGRIILKYGRYE